MQTKMITLLPHLDTKAQPQLKVLILSLAITSTDSSIIIEVPQSVLSAMQVLILDWLKLKIVKESEQQEYCSSC